MIDLKSIEDALRAWLIRATGLPTEKIIFGHQQIPQLPYLTLSVGPFRRVGGVDEIRATTNLAAPQGEEVEQLIVGQRTFIVHVQAFTLQESNVGTAKELLAAADTWAGAPSQREAFATAGFTFLYSDPMTALPRLGREQQGRAALDLHFAVASEVKDPVGYIDRCTPSGTFTY